MTKNPIKESLPYDSPIPDGQQPAWHAVVHLLIPCFDQNGTPVDSEAAAFDYVSETLRGQFLDWGYVRTPEGDMQSPLEIIVCDPYVEGTFLDEEDAAPFEELVQACLESNNDQPGYDRASALAAVEAMLIEEGGDVAKVARRLGVLLPDSGGTDSPT